MNNSLEWRRSKVLELSSHGYNQSDISKILQIRQPTISRDLRYLEKQIKYPTNGTVIAAPQEPLSLVYSSDSFIRQFHTK